MIMDIILYTYIIDNDNNIIQEIDSDDDPKFEKPISSTSNTNFNIVIADDDKHQSNIEQPLIDKNNLFVLCTCDV